MSRDPTNPFQDRRELAEHFSAEGSYGCLSTIIAWYQTLPKPARERLSLAHLHNLAKLITTEQTHDH